MVGVGCVCGGVGCGLFVGELAGKTKKTGGEGGLLVLGCGGWEEEEV